MFPSAFMEIALAPPVSVASRVAPASSAGSVKLLLAQYTRLFISAPLNMGWIGIDIELGSICLSPLNGKARVPSEHDQKFLPG